MDDVSLATRDPSVGLAVDLNGRVTLWRAC